MDTLVTFIIPVRHQENSTNWKKLKSNLAQVLASIAGQTVPSWRAVVVANDGADLPAMPTGIDVVRVNFPPNPLHEQGESDKETFYEAIRLDKGRRVLRGMLHVKDTAFYMVVDDDDFVSNQIVSFISQNSISNGWKIQDGYVWGDGGKLLFLHHDFSNFCGTSLIIRSDLYQLPKSFDLATDDYIKTMLGSHVKIANLLANKGAPLDTLPFKGAVYRIGHVNSHSKSPSLIKLYFLNKYLILRPHKLLRNLSKLRCTTSAFRKEFFGLSS